MDKVELLKMNSSANSLHAPVSTPTTGVGDYSITNRQIVLGNIMYYREFNPLRDFENEYEWQYSTGSQLDARLAAVTQTALNELAAGDINDGLENLIWNGDTTSGSAHLSRFDGLIKLLDADSDSDLNNVTFGAALTAANIIDKLEAMIAACPSAVLENLKIKFVVSHADKYKLFDAYRDATITKGINLMESGVPRFAGIEVVSCGIPENKALLGVFDSSQNGSLQAGTWMDQDRGVVVNRIAANSEDFFIKSLMKFGVNYVKGSELVYGKQ
tara:strand:- start:4132 stop:4947 length:816 start_codon:yes stop_codon:yes gene_type:complete